ncbi:SH3 domain-containing protein [Butyrivibrio sp. XPD2006]|uniref:SH3 domain-containing protein n=1 Tax=Butyrivibrio sp. XPD2006 TaxID=1280668 RepID=UPI0003B719AD|nr:SH3 domain-containing protein [Butyrivibrio sp. XPD2006]
MSDKITNFEDYKNKAVTPEPVSQDTMNIEIEDPYQFLNAEEREEYILQRRKELGEDVPKEPRKEPEEDRPHKEEPVEERREKRREPRQERRQRDPEPRRRPSRERYESEDDPDYDEDYDGDDGYDEDDAEGGINMNLVVRVASILTGIIILAIVAMALKVKVYDRYFAPDPDEAPASVAAPAIPAGFIEKNDTVVVTGASTLNIRSVPSSESKDTVVGLVPEGDELKRIAVSEDGHWALVEVDGQQVYASMKYLKEK